MATLNAVYGTVDIDMTSNSTVDHAAQATPVNSSEYQLDDDQRHPDTRLQLRRRHHLRRNLTARRLHTRLQAVNSYTVGGLVGDLVTMTAPINNENYWRTNLAGGTTIFASSTANFRGMGDSCRSTAARTAWDLRMYSRARPLRAAGPATRLSSATPTSCRTLPR